ncbi:HlyD family secretion protein [Spongiivirga citrea]|uniref:HlyD family efflux transporter periplasmic adaptor subunit n=1 Tax=Spongiivirga citrea TaxID=1481457 RepID=A0A6M0CPG7_9FLAO|nr:HlyD family efflux transporter periplasmic adaptor subunit [Spongiivirga citrea]NER17367.1 HlyD family efflux transporter periplasmic adaptor subunit [Spongiivirga citrea]
MRTFSYQKETAKIRTLKEPVVKKKRFNFDRLIYFILVLIAFGFLAKYLYTKVAIIEANGMVVMDKIDVNFTQDIRLKRLQVQEGDSVLIGQNLFSYQQHEFDNEAAVILRSQEKTDKKNSHIQNLHFKIAQKRIERNNLYNHINQLEQQLDKMIKLVLLDVYTKEKLDGLKNQILLVKNKISLLNNEISFLNSQTKLLINNGSSSSNPNKLLDDKEGASSYRSNYRSPINGIIGQIHKNKEESCYKGEQVMTIHNTEKVFIKAYFEIKDISEIKEGDIVNVTFPDNRKGKGVISKLYVSTYTAPTEFQNKYEPTQRNILAEVLPIQDNQKPSWSAYHMLNVSISLNKVLD